MGYYADGGGFIQLRTKDDYLGILKWLDEEDVFERYTDGQSEKNYTIYLYNGEKYYEDDWYNLIEKTAGKLADGEIEFHGEDGALWAFIVNDDGTLVEYSGHVVYDIGSTSELVGQIIDGFEDFLDKRGIVLANDEKADDPECAANIYGTDYGELQTYIEDTLRNWGLIE